MKSISAGATLKINYYDTTTGSEDLLERYDLPSHALITYADVGKTFRTLVSRIHNKPIVEAIVTGGAIEFGVYVTVVSDFPSDAPFLSGSDANLSEDRGNPVVIYDPSDDKWYAMQGTAGVLNVNSSSSLSGSGKVTEVELVFNQWTVLPTTAGRSAISIVNRTGQQVKVNYSDLVVGDVGIPIEDGQDRNYDIKSNIVQYVKPEFSDCTILVEELG